MRNTIILFALLIFACSGDDSSDSDNNSNLNDTILVDTIEISFLSSNGCLYQSTRTFNYNGNKLISCSYSSTAANECDDAIDGVVNYQYNDENQISKIYFWEGDTAEFEYDALARLSQYTYTENNEGPFPIIGIATFNYSQDSIVTMNWDNGTSFNFSFDLNGNLTTSTSNNITAAYTYDNAKHPFSNLEGHHWLIQSFYYSPFMGQKNNMLTGQNENNVFFYTYNENNYPLTINSPNGYESWSNIQATITYTN